MYAHPQPSSANRTGYYVESTDAHPLPIGKLGHFTAHIHCLRIIAQGGLDVGVTHQLHERGHTSPEMTMLYVEVASVDLQREFQRARSKPRHLAPQPTTSLTILRTGLDGVIDSLRAAQHALEMFRRALPIGAARSCLDRLSNRLTKIVTEARKLGTP